MKIKMTGLQFASVLLPAFITFGLNGCSSTQPVSIKSEAAIVNPKPMEPEPAPDLAAIADQPGDEMVKVLAPNFPERYVVVKGDTLWGISKRFLKDPWLWPSVWHINPSIRNPHLIYPGDIIVMYIVDGKPYITLDGQAGVVPVQAVIPSTKTKTKTTRGAEPVKPGLKVVKLSPSSRISGIHKAISTIPMSAIRPFLDRPRVITEDDIENAPYVVSSYEEHLISGTGNRLYARNLTKPKKDYNLVRPGIEYEDPETGEVLGYEAVYLADARLLKTGDDDVPATLIVVKALREVLNNDILIPHENREQQFQFIPRPPSKEVKGQIMAVFDGVSQIGQYMVVVLNRGSKAGLEPGHVLAVLQKGAEVNDSRRLLFTSVTLPDERAGIMMVFKTYDNLSYALIMEANRAMHINDRFENP